jgi:hypothetical protein
MKGLQTQVFCFLKSTKSAWKVERVVVASSVIGLDFSRKSRGVRPPTWLDAAVGPTRKPVLAARRGGLLGGGGATAARGEGDF